MKKKQYFTLILFVFAILVASLGYYLFKTEQKEVVINTMRKDTIDLKSVIGTTTAKNIREVNFETLLKIVTYGETSDFPDCSPDRKPIYLNSAKYFDFDGDGQEEAIVRATSCFTGTAGPDIDGVYKLSSIGEVIELKVNDNNGIFNGNKIYEHGRKDYGYDIKDNRLINIIPIYKDSDGNCCPSGGTREIMYDWNGNEFVISSVTQNEDGNTSEITYPNSVTTSSNITLPKGEKESLLVSVDAFMNEYRLPKGVQNSYSVLIDSRLHDSIKIIVNPKATSWDTKTILYARKVNGES